MSRVVSVLVLIIAVATPALAQESQPPPTYFGYLLLYGAVLTAATFVAIKLSYTDNPPSFAYLAFAIFAAALVVLLMIDTRWYTRLLNLRVELGGQSYGLTEIRHEIAELRSNLTGFETDTLTTKDLGATVQVSPLPGATQQSYYKYSARLTLKHAPVKNSVLIWDNMLAVPPSAYEVEDQTVILKTTHPPGEEFEYVVRYFRQPEASGELYLSSVTVWTPGSSGFMGPATADQDWRNVAWRVPEDTTWTRIDCTNPKAQGSGLNHDVTIRAFKGAFDSLMDGGTNFVCIITGSDQAPGQCHTASSLRLNEGDWVVVRLGVGTAVSSPAYVNCTVMHTL